MDTVTRRVAGRAVRELGQLLAGAAIGLAGMALVYVLLWCVPLTLLGGVGIVLFCGVAWTIRRLAGQQRRRVDAVLGRAVPSPYVPLPTGPLARARTLLADPATWRDLAWLPCQFVAGVAGLWLGFGLWLAALECLCAPLLTAVLPARTSVNPAVLEVTDRSQLLTWLLVPTGALLAIVAYRLPRHLIGVQARLAGWLLSPSTTARLAARVDRLTTTRAAAAEVATAELRRVERDLHDGAQARLVGLTMHLGMARDVLDADPAAAGALLAHAQADAGAALSELRDLVRGIHPPVLADRGLADAVQALALTTATPTDLDLHLGRRLPAPVERAAYFAVAEALVNAVRHSGAHRVGVTIIDTGSALRITVRDEGRGGADPARGTGLRGIQRRLSIFDGTLHVASPPGGPTILDMELPCAS